MLTFKRIGDKYIEVCETKFLGDCPKDRHSYTYYSLSGEFKIVNDSQFRLSEEWCDRHVADGQIISCDHYYRDYVINHWVPKMIRDEIEQAEAMEYQAKIEVARDHYLRMQAEHTKLTNHWWNSHHGSDHHGRLIYGSDDVEIELEKQHSVFSVKTKIDLLEKYYGIDHPYYIEYQKNILKNHSEYRKSLGMEA
jgi:uncharacterized protein (DUF1499 family)